MLPSIAGRLNWPWSSTSRNFNQHYLPLAAAAAPAGHTSTTATTPPPSHQYHHHHHHVNNGTSSEKDKTYKHYSTDSISSQNTVAWSGDYTGSPPSPSPWTYLSIARKAIALLLHALTLLLAAYGAIMFFQVQMRGRYMRIPVYSKFDIAQAGWSRPELVADFGGTGHSHSPLPQHSPSPPQDPPLAPSTVLQLYDFDQASPSLSPAGDAPSVFGPAWPSDATSTSHLLPISKSINDLHVLILTPLKNAQSNLHSYLSLLGNLQHPKQNVSVGFLIGDEEDDTGSLVYDWCREQEQLGEYRKITLLKKDFGLQFPGGDARHENWIQGQRR